MSPDWDFCSDTNEDSCVLGYDVVLIVIVLEEFPVSILDSPEDEGSKPPPKKNGSNYLPNNTALWCRRLDSSLTIWFMWF